MAQTRPPKPTSKSHKGSAGWFFAFVLLVSILAAFLPASLLILAAGLIPTATAYITDRSPGSPLFRTVLPLNLAGISINIVSLWHQHGGYADAVRLLQSPSVWLIMYLAAAAGTLLHFIMPSVMTAILRDRLNRRRSYYERTIENMRSEWGIEVCPHDGPEQQPTA